MIRPLPESLAAVFFMKRSVYRLIPTVIEKTEFYLTNRMTLC